MLSLSVLERNAITLRDLGFRRIFLLNGGKCNKLNDVLFRLNSNYGIYLEEVRTVSDVLNVVGEKNLVFFTFSNSFLPAVKEDLKTIIEENEELTLLQGSYGNVIAVFGPIDEVKKILENSSFVKTGDPHLIEECDPEYVKLDYNPLISNQEDFKFWEKRLLKSMIKSEDGIISRHFNRKISLFMTRFLIKTPVTPNMISLSSFLIIILAALFFLRGDYISGLIGGILAQFSAILDGCDGEIARLKHRPSKFGAFFDTMLDRYSDIVLIAAIGFSKIGLYPLYLVLLFYILALPAQIISGLARKEFTLRYNTPPPDNTFFRLTRRDARIFSIFLGALFGLAFEFTLIYSIFVHTLVISGYLKLARELD